MPFKTADRKTLNFWQLAWETSRVDRRSYQRKQRPLSWPRIGSLLNPNLDRPIFIVGCARSGTTFLGKCIGALPGVSYHCEPAATKAVIPDVYHGRWSHSKARWFYRNVYVWLMRQYVDTDLRFAEKTPGNCFMIPFLADIFPGAQFVNIIRDVRDVAASYIRKGWLTSGTPNAYHRWLIEPSLLNEFETATQAQRCAMVWRRHVESARQAGSRLATGRYLEVSYELLAQRNLQEADKILSFLGETNGVSVKAFHNQIAKANPASIGLGKRELSAAQLQAIGNSVRLPCFDDELTLRPEIRIFCADSQPSNAVNQPLENPREKIEV